MAESNTATDNGAADGTIIESAGEALATRSSVRSAGNKHSGSSVTKVPKPP